MSNGIIPANQNQLSLADTEKLGSIFIKSGFFKDTADCHQAIVKILAGKELGLEPFAAMSAFNIIQGKVCLAANTLAMLIKRSGKYDYRVTKHTDAECVITILQNNEPIGTADYSITQANKANLLGKTNWKMYPKDMLFARAISRAFRMHCPDVTTITVYTEDELEENPEPPKEEKHIVLTQISVPDKIEKIPEKTISQVINEKINEKQADAKQEVIETPGINAEQFEKENDVKPSKTNKLDPLTADLLAKKQQIDRVAAKLEKAVGLDKHKALDLATVQLNDPKLYIELKRDAKVVKTAAKDMTLEDFEAIHAQFMLFKGGE